MCALKTLTIYQIKINAKPNTQVTATDTLVVEQYPLVNITKQSLHFQLSILSFKVLSL